MSKQFEDLLASETKLSETNEFFLSADFKNLQGYAIIKNIKIPLGFKLGWFLQRGYHND